MASNIPDFTKLTIVQLREQLKCRGLSVGGSKAILIDRLAESFLNEEKILNADVSMPKDGLDEVLDVSVNEDDVLESVSPNKKIKINHTSGAKKSDNANKTDGVQQVGMTDGKLEEPIDPKQKRAERFGLPPTAEQKMKMRAERFGLTSLLPGDGDYGEEKRRKRAERFGMSLDVKHGNEMSKSTEVDKDLLRKRAERFGLELKDGIQRKKNNILGETDIPSAEVLERRAKRFGICNEKAEIEIKKQKRAERFGINRT